MAYAMCLGIFMRRKRLILEVCKYLPVHKRKVEEDAKKQLSNTGPLFNNEILSYL